MPLWGASPRARQASTGHTRKRSDRHRRDDRGRQSVPEKSSPESVVAERHDSYHSSSSSSQSRRGTNIHLALGPNVSINKSRSSLPYPNFSKAHSREVLTRDDDPEDDRYASPPKSTDPRPIPLKERGPRRPSWPKDSIPPSPPSTVAGSGELNPIQFKRQEKKRRSETSTAKHLRFSASRTSLRHAEEGRSSSNTSARSSVRRPRDSSPHIGPAPPIVSSTRRSTQSLRTPARNLQRPAAATASDGGSTHEVGSSSGPPPAFLSNGEPSPDSEYQPHPHTPPTQTADFTNDVDSGKQTPVIEVFASTASTSDFEEGTLLPESTTPAARSSLRASAPPPPPPPPPPISAAELREIPRVDYLLHNGGLEKRIPRNFSSASRDPHSSSYQPQTVIQTATSRAADMNQVLAPYQDLLGHFEEVIGKNGSVAVATGYKSVARRLLDRLEAVFSRNISSELCDCVMCNTAQTSHRASGDDRTGVSWGEVLELVSGRKSLPTWPPFSLLATSHELGTEGLRSKTPMQELDVDVPEEYRDHYIRQSKKTKESVDKWLAGQPEEHASPPTEVDDETLNFAMLTHLKPPQRRTFTALVRGMSEVPETRAPTPALGNGEHGSRRGLQVMQKTAVAIQRLYRLAKAPRESECAIYLLDNPSIHSALATLAAISVDEWEILVSGRFDGFLVSGAEARFPSMGPAARAQTPSSRYTPSRAAPSRGAAPSPLQGGPPAAQAGLAPGPVQVDEETEIAVLAEVEREIYLGMDALEDAMEALHVRAEAVRKALRDRSAGLSLQARGHKSVGEEPRAVAGTPCPGSDEGDSRRGTPSQGLRASMRGDSTGGGADWEAVGGLMDDTASLAPDDSASNVGWRERSKNRHRKRRPRRMATATEESGD